MLSEAGDIAYLVPRGDYLATEVWVMRADGSGKHRVKTYTGFCWDKAGSWLPGSQRLFVRTGSLMWTNPDFSHHQARLLGGAILDKTPPLGQREWVLDVATGQDELFALPAGYQALYKEVSPDGRLLAFYGRYRPDPTSLEHLEGGVWIYNLRNGTMKKVLNGVMTPFSWSPDSRFLAATTGGGYFTHYPLVIVDVTTSGVRDLHVQMQGGGASFSLDGTKLAYSGVPGSGSIFVLDLKAGGKPRPLSPVGEGLIMPRWSPDGKRLLYVKQDYDSTEHVEGFRLLVANVDGSGAQEIFQWKGFLQAAEWSPSGDAVYVVGRQLDPSDTRKRFRDATSILAVAADGSGRVTDLGGNANDSFLPPRERAQTEAAFSDLREAVYQYEVGKIRSYEGRARDAKAAFRASADIFASLVWKHPLSGFGSADLAAYVDYIEPLANQSDEALIRDSCRQRITYFLSFALQLFAGRHRYFPADLAAVEKWSLTTDWGMKIEWIDHTDTDWVKMIFRCPKGDSYVFHPTPNGAYPKVGDVIATCPNHPECRLVWTEGMANGRDVERAVGDRSLLAKQRRR